MNKYICVVIPFAFICVELMCACVICQSPPTENRANGSTHDRWSTLPFAVTPTYMHINVFYTSTFLALIRFNIYTLYMNSEVIKVHIYIQFHGGANAFQWKWIMRKMNWNGRQIDWDSHNSNNSKQICPNFYSMTFGLTFYQHTKMMMTMITTATLTTPHNIKFCNKVYINSVWWISCCLEMCVNE